LREDYRAEFADSKTDLSNGEEKYLWVNSKNGYLTVTFDDDGNVKMYNGFC